MSDRYLPPSGFLNAVINDEIALTGSEYAEVNLRRLIDMTSDHDLANRDWATLLLAQLELDRTDVRAALLAAADDSEACVRAEAILGLAQLDKALALPLLRKELLGECASMPIFEAALIVAHPSLVDDLSAFANPTGDEFLDGLAFEALQACQAGAKS